MSAARRKVVRGATIAACPNLERALRGKTESRLELMEGCLDAFFERLDRLEQSSANPEAGPMTSIGNVRRSARRNALFRRALRDRCDVRACLDVSRLVGRDGRASETSCPGADTCDLPAQ